MYWNEHMPPHFHAEYADFKAIIDIMEAVVLRGYLPSRQLKLVLAWCEIHEQELMQNWESAQQHGNLIEIEPLHEKEEIMLHDVIQVLPQKDFTVYVYFSDGQIKLYDMKPYLNKGIFEKISKIDVFMNKCTVMNNTLAWDISGNFNPNKCIDIDPETIYMDGESIRDPLISSA